MCIVVQYDEHELYNLIRMHLEQGMTILLLLIFLLEEGRFFDIGFGQFWRVVNNFF